MPARIRFSLLLVLLSGLGCQGFAEQVLSLLPATSTGCLEAAVEMPAAARLRLTWLPAPGAARRTSLEVWSQRDGEPGERIASLPFDTAARERSATVDLGARAGEVRMLRVLAGAPVAWKRADLVGRGRNGEPPAWRVAPRPGAPDVIVYVLDTLRPDVLGAYGGPGPTPTLDRLASQGLLFERAYSTSTWTRPAVASLVSGLPVSAHGVKSEAFSLPEGALTLAERFRLRGYQTVGVIANGHLVPAFHFDQGFEVYDSPPFVDDAGTWDPEGVTSNAAAAAVHALALRRLAEVRDRRRPLFLYVHVVDPHQPYRPPEWVLKEPRPALRVNNFLLRSINDGEGGSERLLAGLELAYRGAVAYADRELGRFLARLTPYADLDRAVVLVTSDHGEAFFEHRFVGHRNWPYEELTRVPMLLRAPGVAAGGRNTLPVSLLDVVPTLLGLADPRPEPAAGLAPGVNLLAKDAAARLARRGALSEFGDCATLVDGEWKLTYHGEYPEGLRLRLFNLRLDPAEGDDRFLGEPGIARRLEDALREGQATARRAALEPLPVDAGRLSTGLLHNLRALGYLK